MEGTTATTSRGQAVEVFQAAGESMSNFKYSRYGAPDVEDEANIEASIEEKQIGQGLVFEEDIMEEAGMAGAAAQLTQLKARLVDRAGYVAATKKLTDGATLKRKHRQAVIESREKQQIQNTASIEKQKQQQSSSASSSCSSGCRGLDAVDSVQLKALKARLAAVTAQVSSSTGSAGVGPSAAVVAGDIEAFHRHVMLLQAGVANELTARIEQASKVIQQCADKRKSSLWGSTSRGGGSVTPRGGSTNFETGGVESKVIESTLTVSEKDKLSGVCKQLSDLKGFPELVHQAERRLATMRPVHEAALQIVEDVEFWLVSRPFHGKVHAAIRDRTSALSAHFKQNTQVMDSSLDKLRGMMADLE